MVNMEFHSTTELKSKRAEKNKARELILKEAKRKYDIEERKAQAAKAAGQDTWMLPELSEKIDKESKKISKTAKKLKKEKKKKNDKKSKKEKKKHKRSSSSESEEFDEEESWVEMTKEGNKTITKSDKTNSDAAASTTGAAESEAKPTVKGPQLQRDDWMMLDSADIPSISRQELREKIKQDKLQYAAENDPAAAAAAQKALNIDEPGQHERELNPYWKHGTGTGLPEELRAGSSSNSAAPKHSLEFLQKAYKRCEQMAEDSGQTLDEVAAERYGSLEHLEMMIMEAERAKEIESEVKTNSNNRPNDRTRERSRDRDSSRHKNRLDRSRSRDRNNRDKAKDRYTGSSRERTRNSSQDSDNRYQSRDRRNRSRSKDRSRDSNRTADRLRSRDRNRLRSRSRERNRSRSRDRSRDRRRRDSRSPVPVKRRFMKPGESADSPAEPTAKRKFLRPGESSEDQSALSKPAESSNRPSWRKPGHEPSKPVREVKLNEATEKESNKTQSGPVSDTDSSESDSESEQSSEEEAPPPVVALTDDEMNALGAKILKAEIMGNDEMAQQLKQKLEQARNARAAGVKPAPSSNEEKVVVLSRTDKFGNVRPVQSNEADQARGGGKKRRAKKVVTHDKSGQRERYFPDDDRFNIKDMVQAEKMTSAEDQHFMFSKMAAKVTEKVDDEHQIDDALINRARLEQDPSKLASAQLSQAQADSKRMAQTLDNCHHCLENMTKHLIIAVHKNTYLCVPETQSLAEGHCRIVPIHHCVSSTTCDEDIWNEVQDFRRALVRMFADNDDQDCVFMECSKNLRKHPHMVIECIPMERELGDMAPIYFKKAIQESEKEWSQNKKLVDLSKKDIRHSIPKGFPYFSVNFGLQDGYAHVIEDEQCFPWYFGKEVVGGMMDTDPQLWRKPKKQSFEDQRKKVMNFAKMWKPFDITRKKESSDSE